MKYFLLFTIAMLTTFTAVCQVALSGGIMLTKNKDIRCYRNTDLLIAGPIIKEASNIAQGVENDINSINLPLNIETPKINFAEGLIESANKERTEVINNIYLSAYVQIKAPGIRLMADIGAGTSNVSGATFKSAQGVYLSPGILQLFNIDLTSLEIGRNAELTWYDCIEVGFKNKLSFESIIYGQGFEQSVAARLQLPIKVYQGRKGKTYLAFIEQSFYLTDNLKNIGSYNAGISIQLK